MTKKLSHLIIGTLVVVSAHTEPTNPKQPSDFDNGKYINANSLLMMVSNTGLYANDPDGVFGYGYGMFYPFTSIQNILNGTQISSPLYSAGLWLGGKVGGQTRVTIADFSSEYWPGPISAGTYLPSADTSEVHRVYKLYSDSLSANPNQDYTDWPITLGAPTDQFGVPLLRGSQTLWSVYNDVNPTRHTNVAGSSTPLGIEVRQTNWASNATQLENTIYIEYQLFNKGNDTVIDLYVGLFFDPDIGGAQDDLTASDSLAGMIYSYNADNSDLVYGNAPPALGIKLLYGPVVTSPGDSAISFGQIIHEFKNLPLTSYVGYHNGDDSQSPVESYNLLRGLARNGSPLANGTRFSYPGNPIDSTGDLDTTAGNPHGLGSVGPIDLYPGDSQSVVIKIVVGQGSDRLSSIADLRTRMNLPDSIYSDVHGDATDNLPFAYTLSQNYPNPFNPSTVIEYAVPARARVRLDVLNLLGQHIKTLVAETKGPGTYTSTWDGTNDDREPVTTGVYLYRISMGKYVATRKMLLIK